MKCTRPFFRTVGVGMFLVLLSGIFSACQSRKTQQLPTGTGEASPYEMMIGSFGSAEQATGDTSYYNLTLHIYPIWENDGENEWLYVEQALSGQPMSPYRQRVYKIERQGPDEYECVVYKLKNDRRFVGKWQAPDFFDGFDQGILQESEGCAVSLKAYHSGGYIGTTSGKNCKSSMNGASYATTKLKIEKDKITSWDQGFDKDGRQVWGTLRGGYVYKRLE